MDTKCRRAGLRRNEIAASLTTAYREKKNAKNGAIRVLSLHYFLLRFCMLALPCFVPGCVEQVNERKLVCAWCMEKLR
jgi:hypothetical protein